VVEVPVIDVAPLRGEAARRDEVVRQLDAACRESGFFYAVGHGVDPALQDRLDSLAREFFALDDDEKARIAMHRGGRAWRGWFPLGGELTSGVPDRKEGLYFGAELGPDHPRVAAGVPLHGPNLFPERPAGLRGAVLDYLDALTELGHLIVGGLALGLGLDRDWFATHFTADPTILFRIFTYPPDPPNAPGGGWGVAEHTDYGLLTMLHQDSAGGLEVRTPEGWTAAPPVPGSFVCNLGDMLERMTGGRYRSTPHRVRNPGQTNRVSFAFFFDPSWDADVVPVPMTDRSRDGGSLGTGRPDDARWDGASVHDFRGTYGDYLLAKVAKVFPELGGEVLDT
jgi:isopenicillin N synthase-like dioxygenase